MGGRELVLAHSNAWDCCRLRDRLSIVPARFPRQKSRCLLDPHSSTQGYLGERGYQSGSCFRARDGFRRTPRAPCSPPHSFSAPSLFSRRLPTLGRTQSRHSRFLPAACAELCRSQIRAVPRTSVPTLHQESYRLSGVTTAAWLRLPVSASWYIHNLPNCHIMIFSVFHPAPLAAHRSRPNSRLY